MMSTGEQVPQDQQPTVITFDELVDPVLKACIPTGYISREGELDARSIRTFGARLGGTVVAVAGMDIVFTWGSRAFYSADQDRDQAQARMDGFVDGVQADLTSQGAKNMIICRDPGYDGVCALAEEYDVTNPAAIARFVADSIAHETPHISDEGGLLDPEKEALSTSISTVAVSPDGEDRTPATDAAMFGAMHTATEQYVSTIPDHAYPTTEGYTGEVLVAGTSIILTTALFARAIRILRQRQGDRGKRAYSELVERQRDIQRGTIVVDDDTSGTTVSTIRYIKQQLPWEYDNNKVVSGGRRERQRVKKGAVEARNSALEHAKA